MTQAKRLPGLDGLRALSILLVIASHIAYRVEYWNSPVLRSTFTQFAFGVDIFFVISGFIITHILLKEETATGGISLRKFYLRRAFRILPPAFAYLAVICLLAAIGLFAFELKGLAACIFFFRNYYATGLRFTGHFWSLSVEEQFYLLWPVVLILLPKKSRLYFCVVMCAIEPIYRAANILIWGEPHVNWMRLDLRYDSLLSGVTAALIWNRESARQWLRRRNGLGVYAFFAAIVGAFLLDARIPRLAILTVPFRFWCVAAIVLLLISTEAKAVHRVFDCRLAVWIGQISYSLYLWQQLIINYPIGSGWLPIALAVVVAFLCAAMSYYLIEQRSLTMRARIGI